MTPESLRVEGTDGLEIHLLRWSREGVGMMLVHGFSNEAHIWEDFAPAVAPHYGVHAMDLRGHGESDWDPEARYEYDNHAADLGAVLDALAIERVVLVGHSLGGRVSTLFTAANPGRVAGLVIVDAGPELDRRGVVRIQQDTEQHQNPVFDTVAQYENMLAHSYPAATAESIKRMARHGLRQRDDGRHVLRMDISFRTRAAGEIRPEELAEYEERTTAALWGALEKIACPTLVLRGAASDILSPDTADKMVEEALPNGTLAVVPQAGHSVMTDNPAGFREAVCGFVLGE